jgi:glutathione peroxidase
MSVYDFKFQTADGRETSLAPFQGKPILIVNVASACGLTPQYAGLQELHDTYGKRGLVVVGFPCNQFGGQEPGTDDDIQLFCSLNYGVTFPVFAKIDVNGERAHPLFRFLQGPKPIEWNFAKFLIGRDGRVKRYAPQTEPNALVPDIEAALSP